MNKEGIKNELEKIAPELARLQKLNAFTVPPGYFDILPQQIQQKIQSDVPAFSPVRRWSLVPLAFISGLAAFVFVIAGYFLLTKESTDSFVNIAGESFFEDHLAWYSEYQPEVFYDIVLNESTLPENMSNVAEDHIIEYLVDYEYLLMEQIMPAPGSNTH